MLKEYIPWELPALHRDLVQDVLERRGETGITARLPRSAPTPPVTVATTQWPRPPHGTIPWTPTAADLGFGRATTATYSLVS